MSIKKGNDLPIYDLVTGNVIDIECGAVVSFFKKIGVHYTSYCHLKSGKIKELAGRYILHRDIDKIFILVDVDTNEEYECFTNTTIFKHLGLPYNNNESKYVYELKSKRQKFASICGRVFKMKNGKEKCKIRLTKNDSNFIKRKHSTDELKRKVKSRIYKRIWSLLSKNNISKKSSYNELIGCDSADFYKYIESKFTTNMGWHNKNKWHIDHIVPCDNFNIFIDKERMACFHYTNLQPIWKNNRVAKEMGENDWYVGNLNKNNSLDFVFDYSAVKLLSNYIPENQAVEIAKYIFSKGIRKTIPLG